MSEAQFLGEVSAVLAAASVVGKGPLGWLFADVWAWAAVLCVPAGVNLFVS